MDIPDLFANSDLVEADKLFLAILFTDQSVQAGLWQVSNGLITILKQSEVYHYADHHQALVKTDEALQHLGKLSENVNEVVFGLKKDWISQSHLGENQKFLLKKVTEELSLKAVGYVVMTEALVHSLTVKEPHLSTIVCTSIDDQLEVSLINRGKLAENVTVGQSVDLVSDLTEALARIQSKLAATATHLPSQILIVGLGDNDDQLRQIQQAWLAHDWTRTQFFLQPPTIDILPPETMMMAVVSEGGRAVARAQGIMTQSLIEEPHSPLPALAPVGSATDYTPIQSHQTLFPGSDNDQPLVTATANVTKTRGRLSAGVNRFLSRWPAQLLNHGWRRPWPTQPTEHFEPRSTAAHHQAEHHLPAQRTIRWFEHHLTFVYFGFGAGLLVLIVVGYLALTFNKTATVQLQLKAKLINQQLALTLDPQAKQSDPQRLVIKADRLTKTVNGAREQDTSGVKLVGDKATGTVNLLNKTDATKTLAAGTVLAKDQLKFMTNEEVTIASASVSQTSNGETKTYGKAQVKVTAAQIGADSNLAVSSLLQVADWAASSYQAEVQSALSGGSSREVRVLSKEDRNQLLSSLKKDLISQAQTALQTEVASDQYLVPTGQVKVVSSQFSAEVGQEVQSVELTMEAEIEALVYAKSELKPLAQALLQTALPSGYRWQDGVEPQILSQPAAATAAGVLILDADLSLPAIPDFDEVSWRRELAGQSISSGEAILRGKGEVESATIQLSPPITRWLSPNLPINPDQITLVY